MKEDIQKFVQFCKSRDKILDSLYGYVEKRKLKNKQLDKIYQDLQCDFNLKHNKVKINERVKKDKELWISCITVKELGNERYKEEFHEYIRDLVDHNLDFEEKIEKQGKDLKYYSQFLLAIFHLIHGISYLEAVNFVNNLKQDFKVINSRKKNKITGSAGVNFYFKDIKF